MYKKMATTIRVCMFVQKTVRIPWDRNQKKVFSTRFLGEIIVVQDIQGFVDDGTKVLTR